jgi:hypothetical protein
MILNQEYNQDESLLKGYYIYREYLTITAGEITIPEGYKWNGCTLAPDFKKTYYASLVHDALYQYKCGRKLADKVFYKMLKEEGFKLAWIYYAGTRLFGWMFY